MSLEVDDQVVLVDFDIHCFEVLFVEHVSGDVITLNNSESYHSDLLRKATPEEILSGFRTLSKLEKQLIKDVFGLEV